MSETIAQLKKILEASEVEKDYAIKLVAAGKQGRKYAILDENEIHERQSLTKEIASNMATVESFYGMFKRKSFRSKKFVIPKLKLYLPIKK